MESDWANLLPDLLVDIAMKFDCVEQLIRFSAVCSSWRAVYARVKPVWTPSMPWMIMPEFHRSNSGNLRTVFDPNLNKSYQMDLPELFSCRCWGCQDGWIFTLNLNMEINLFNPLTKTHLSMPSAHSIAYDFDVDSFDRMEQTHFLREYIQKVFLLNIPPNNELVVMLVCNYSKWIAYSKPGDTDWRYMCVHGPSRSVKDVVSFGESFMILYDDWNLAIVGMDYFLDATEYKAKLLPTKCEKTRGFDDNDIYLVDSSGYLHMVCPYYAEFTFDDSDDDEQNGGTETVTFDVFIFDVDRRRWDKIWDLEDAALFVGGGSSMSICSSKAANCKRNCIYFVADKPQDVINLFRWEPVNPLGKDIGIFKLGDSCLEEFYDEDYSPCSQYCPPFWFMPKLV